MIDQEKKKLWDILCDWIKKRLTDVSNKFEQSVIDITDLAERSLNEQQKIIEYHFEEQKQFLDRFELEYSKVVKSRNKLEQEFRKKLYST